MERADAELALRSDAPEHRLRAARFFALNATPQDRTKLRQAAQIESVPWIKRALEHALLRTEFRSTADEGAEVNSAGEPDETLVRQLHAEAVEEVAGTILHEFSALIGPLRAVAGSEVRDYSTSQTKQLLDRLSALMAAVRTLKRAAATPSYEQVDLTDLVRGIVEEQGQLADVTVKLGRYEPLRVEADPNQLRLAIANGLRNAIEAVRGFSRIKPAEVVVNWGAGGADCWLVIIDTGPGFPGNPASALKLGATNKNEHTGFGLTIAQQAMWSMEGDVYVKNADAGGAHFEIRWYRENANTVR